MRGSEKLVNCKTLQLTIVVFSNYCIRSRVNDFLQTLKMILLIVIFPKFIFQSNSIQVILEFFWSQNYLILQL